MDYSALISVAQKLGAKLELIQIVSILKNRWAI